MVSVYTKRWDEESFGVHDVFIAPSDSGCKEIPYFENGQTVWYYIEQTNPNTGESSNKSNTYRSTPPITAYIINWPDILQDLKDLNNELIKAIEGLFKPSDQAMSDLQDSINDLKDALGVSSAEQVGNDLTSGLESTIGGLSPAGIVDDGNGTFTGGSTGGQLPFPNQTIGDGSGGAGGISLESPNPDSGTDTELTMRIPIGINLDGSLYYIKLFTKEQMEKMKWLGLIRTLAAATMYILFAIWLVSRFAPQLKS